MDIARKKPGWRRMLGRGLLAIAAIGLVVSVSVALSRLEPADPVIDRASLAMGTVKRGTMLREVRGPGNLVSEEVTFVTAKTDGRIKQVLAQPGVTVQPDTVLVELENPNVLKLARDAALDVKTAEYELNAFKVQLEQQSLNLKAETARAAAAFDESRLQADIDEELGRAGLISARQQKLSRSRAEQARDLRDIQLQRVQLSQQTIVEQLAVKQDRVALAMHNSQLRENDAESLTVRAGTAGVLQQLGPTPQQQLEVGQQVGSGMVLAMVTNPQRLKAVLKIGETQARELVVGQNATIQTLSRQASIPGRVLRIDPAIQQGTVAVDVELLGALPQEARPDLSVDGTIEIERVEDALYVDSPIVYTQPFESLTLFKVDSDGSRAVRTRVKIGRKSVFTVEVVEGLKEGDQVITSDVSRWDRVDRVNLR